MQKREPYQEISVADIYAVYGEALFWAQFMEVGLRIFYDLEKALQAAPPGRLPKLDLDREPLSEINTVSLGGYVRKFRREVEQEGSLDEAMRQTIRQFERTADERNWLIHTYWWERGPQLASAGGRARAQTELRRLTERFQRNSKIIRQLVLACLAHYGLTPAQINSRRLDEYLREWGTEPADTQKTV